MGGGVGGRPFTLPFCAALRGAMERTTRRWRHCASPGERVVRVLKAASWVAGLRWVIRRGSRRRGWDGRAWLSVVLEQYALRDGVTARRTCRANGGTTVCGILDAALVHCCVSATTSYATAQILACKVRNGVGNNGLMARRHPADATIPEVLCAVLVEAGTRMDNERLQTLAVRFQGQSQRDGSIKQTGGRARLEPDGGGQLANHRRSCSRAGGADRVSRAPRLFRDFQVQAKPGRL